jgi:Rhodanese-like domain
MRQKRKTPTLAHALIILVGLTFVPHASFAEPSRYPEFAQQKLPATVTPAFITIDQLVAEVKAGTKPVILDVRSGEEFQESHILGSVSAPIGDFGSYIEKIPRDRLVVLY